ISTSSPTFTRPRSMRPVATVPRPEIVNTSSTHIKNALSTSRRGSGMKLSTASLNCKIAPSPNSPLSPSNARNALPRPVHLRRPDAQVLAVVGLPRTVHMRIVAPPGLVLPVRRINRAPPLALLRRLIDLLEGHELRQLPAGQHLGDRRCQGRLAMIDMP